MRKVDKHKLVNKRFTSERKLYKSSFKPKELISYNVNIFNKIMYTLISIGNFG